MLPELIDLFQTLGEAAQRASAKPQRKREKYALEILVHNLYMAARQRSGYLAIYKEAIKGTLSRLPVGGTGDTPKISAE
jgi:hypothetical protein